MINAEFILAIEQSLSLALTFLTKFTDDMPYEAPCNYEKRQWLQTLTSFNQWNSAIYVTATFLILHLRDA